MATPPFREDIVNQFQGSQVSINGLDDDLRSSKKSFAENEEENDNEYEEVTPYTITNLTHMKVMVGNMEADPEIFRRVSRNWSDSNRLSNDNIPDIIQLAKIYRLKPGDECQYAVEYDSQTQSLL
mmetsp:Transcript_20897/g.19943  ORF Transcript_20897/g.19943 Transcript_20897/m.19943 type:complete len:125 (+) Transcript_20897:232-606(+)